jgi:hypothetical protein
LKQNKINQEIEFLFESYPILYPNVLEIRSNNQIELFFSPTQNSFIKQFENIELFSGNAVNFSIKNNLQQKEHLFIFLPMTISLLDKGCFKSCPFLSQIQLHLLETNALVVAPHFINSYL